MADEKPYDLYGALSPAWLISMRVDQQGIARAKVKERREAPADAATLQEWSRLKSAPQPEGLVLPCTGISLEWQREDGFWRCEWDYEGHNGDPGQVTFGDPATTTYEIDCSVTTAPIQTHPRFLQIAKQYGVTNKQYDKFGDFLGFPKLLVKDAGLGDDETKNPLYGVEDYYITQMVYRISSSAASLPGDFRRNLGLIDRPRSGGPGAPQLEGRANWLKTVARATWRGNIWATQEEWTASGPDGWNSDIYRPR